MHFCQLYINEIGQVTVIVLNEMFKYAVTRLIYVYVCV